MAKASAPSVYQLKVTLDNVRPAVWRRLLVSSSAKLHQLHDILQIAMGWTDSHMHQFEAQGQLYGQPDPDFGLSVEDETRVPLDQVLQREGASMIYEYDFGDSWIHQIALEKILPASTELKVPSCVAGARACPPEDCGGAEGYAEFLKAIKSPSHPEHEEMMEWSGGDFDPAAFDLEGMNKFFASRKGRR